MSLSRYSSYVLPPDLRIGRFSLSMAWWALFSAMFWIYVGVASASAVGTVNTIIGMVLTVVSYGLINAVLARYAARTGLNVTLWSRSLFGAYGSALASLIFAATAIYYAVFEGSIIAVAFKQYFGGSILLWYAAIVLYAVLLVTRGVQNWMDRLNAWLLPVYVAGLVAVIWATTARQGYPQHWLTQAGADSPLPGWLQSYLIYMGVYIMMMYTVDFARLGKARDERFHRHVTFGWVFYACTFGLNGLVGIYLLAAWHITDGETGVVQVFIKALGLVGVLIILVCQTRINTANYYLASTNLGDFVEQAFRIRLPRVVWVGVAGVIAYLFMLTNVLSYLIKALAWQGVFVTAWVAIALVHIAITARKRDELPEVRPSRLRPVTMGAIAWLVAAGTGIALTEQQAVVALSKLAPLITVVLGAAIYLIIAVVRPPAALKASELDREQTLHTGVMELAQEVPVTVKES